MKKFLFFAAALVAVSATMVSCSQGNGKLDSDIDTLSYAIGVNQAPSMVNVLMRNQVDSVYFDEVLAGIKEVLDNDGDDKTQARVMGMIYGMTILKNILPSENAVFFEDDSTKSLNPYALLAGFSDVMKGKEGAMKEEQARIYESVKREAAIEQATLKQFGKNKEIGAAWLAENAKKEGVVTLPSGVQYKILKEGNGPVADKDSAVYVYYEGRSIDDKVFDSNLTKRSPTKFRINSVVEGFGEILQMMPAGSKWEIYIPEDKGYGMRRAGTLEPYSTLIFTVEVVDEKDVPAPTKPSKSLSK